MNMKKLSLVFCLLTGFLVTSAQVNFELLASLQKMKASNASSYLESLSYQHQEPDEFDDSDYDYDGVEYYATVMQNESFEPYSFSSIEILENECYENRIFCYTDSSNYMTFVKDLQNHGFKQILETYEDPTEKIYRNANYEISITVVSDFTIKIGIFNYHQMFKI